MLAHPHVNMVPLQDVEPGMVLSDDLIDHHGQVLLAKGTTLTKGTIAAIARHDFAAVPIVGAMLTPEEEEAVTVSEAERIETLFRRLDTAMPGAACALYELVCEYRLGRLP